MGGCIKHSVWMFRGSLGLLRVWWDSSIESSSTYHITSLDNITDVSLCWFCLKSTVTFPPARSRGRWEEVWINTSHHLQNTCTLTFYSLIIFSVCESSHHSEIFLYFGRQPWECFCNTPNPFFIRLFLYLFVTWRLNLGSRNPSTAWKMDDIRCLCDGVFWLQATACRAN